MERIVNEMVADRLDGSRPLRLEHPGWNDVSAAIKALDGFHRTEVCLMKKDVDGMAVWGGFEGRYMCEIISEERIETLRNPKALEESEVPIMEGDDADLFPATWTVDLDTVLKAAQTFFEKGVSDETLHWEVRR